MVIMDTSIIGVALPDIQKDLAGAVTVTAGLAAAVFGIVRAPEEGWGSAATLSVLAGAIVLLGIFVAIQSSRREPLMRLGIFRTPNLGAANFAQLLLGAAWIPMRQPLVPPLPTKENHA